MRIANLAVGLTLVLAVDACADGGPVSPPSSPQFAVVGAGVDQFLLAGASVDNGTCGSWADDQYNLQITVRNNGDGTYLMRTEYKAASFVTRAGASPGACQAETPHGSLLEAGIKGKFDAWVEETITSATYNPDACRTQGGGPGGQAAGPCSTRGGFALAVLGCDEGACADNWSWDFQYRSSDKRLAFSYWRDAWPALAPNEFLGDIATQ
jgi:hypothetical protein